MKNGYPIIADEAYFVNPSVYEKQKEFSFQNIVDGYNVLYEFKKPTDEDMKKVIQYPITKEEKATILSGFADEEEAIIHILQNRDEKFEEMISSKFEAIQKRTWKDCRSVILDLFSKSRILLSTIRNSIDYFRADNFSAKRLSL